MNPEVKEIRRNACVRNMKSRVSVASLLLAVFSVVGPREAFAQPEGELINKEGDLATKWKVNDADPKSNIPSVEERNKDPLEFAYFLQDMAARAEGSFRKDDWRNAIKYYEALGHAVPESWISFNRLCYAYGKVGAYSIAAANCGRAVSLPMAKVIDHIRLIDYSIKSERFGTTDVQNIEQSLAHLRKHVTEYPQPAVAPTPKVAPAAAPVAPPGEDKRTREELIQAIKDRQEKRAKAILEGKDPDAAENGKEDARAPDMHIPSEIEFLTCKFAVRIQDAQRLGKCIEELKRLNIDDRQILAFSWAKALISKDEKSANALLQQAKSFGVPETALAAMTAQQQQHFPPLFTAKRVLPALALILALAAVIGGLMRMRRKKLGGAHG